MPSNRRAAGVASRSAWQENAVPAQWKGRRRLRNQTGEIRADGEILRGQCRRRTSRLSSADSRRATAETSKGWCRNSTPRWSGTRRCMRCWEGKRRCFGGTTASASCSETSTKPSARCTSRSRRSGIWRDRPVDDRPHPHPWQSKRHRDRDALGLRDRGQEQQDDFDSGLPRSQGSPRSRRAAGVDDVAGERREPSSPRDGMGP
jgi:hypothetical protein